MKINTIEKLLASLQLMEENLPQYKTAVGASDADIVETTQDRANLQAIKEQSGFAETVKVATNQVKNDVFYGDPNKPLGEVPNLANFVAPFPPLKPGCLDRFNKRAKRYKAAAGYTKEIGIALGIDEPASGSISPDLLIAAALLKDAGNYQYEADFKKQGQSGMAFQWRVKGTEKWSSATNALTSPILINIETPATEGASVQIEIRCRLLKGNDQVGSWSPIYTITVTG